MDQSIRQLQRPSSAELERAENDAVTGNSSHINNNNESEGTLPEQLKCDVQVPQDNTERITVTKATVTQVTGDSSQPEGDTKEIHQFESDSLSPQQTDKYSSCPSLYTIANTACMSESSSMGIPTSSCPVPTVVNTNSALPRTQQKVARLLPMQQATEQSKTLTTATLTTTVGNHSNHLSLATGIPPLGQDNNWPAPTNRAELIQGLRLRCERYAIKFQTLHAMMKLKEKEHRLLLEKLEKSRLDMEEARKCYEEARLHHEQEVSHRSQTATNVPNNSSSEQTGEAVDEVRVGRSSDNETGPTHLPGSNIQCVINEVHTASLEFPNSIEAGLSSTDSNIKECPPPLTVLDGNEQRHSSDEVIAMIPSQDCKAPRDLFSNIGSSVKEGPNQFESVYVITPDVNTESTQSEASTPRDTSLSSVRLCDSQADQNSERTNKSNDAVGMILSIQEDTSFAESKAEREAMQVSSTSDSGEKTSSTNAFIEDESRKSINKENVKDVEVPNELSGEKSNLQNENNNSQVNENKGETDSSIKVVPYLIIEPDDDEEPRETVSRTLERPSRNTSSENDSQQTALEYINERIQRDLQAECASSNANSSSNEVLQEGSLQNERDNLSSPPGLISISSASFPLVLSSDSKDEPSAGDDEKIKETSEANSAKREASKSKEDEPPSKRAAIAAEVVEETESRKTETRYPTVTTSEPLAVLTTLSKGDFENTTINVPSPTKKTIDKAADANICATESSSPDHLKKTTKSSEDPSPQTTKASMDSPQDSKDDVQYLRRGQGLNRKSVANRAIQRWSNMARLQQGPPRHQFHNGLPSVGRTPVPIRIQDTPHFRQMPPTKMWPVHSEVNETVVGDPHGHGQQRVYFGENNNTHPLKVPLNHHQQSPIGTYALEAAQQRLLNQNGGKLTASPSLGQVHRPFPRLLVPVTSQERRQSAFNTVERSGLMSHQRIDRTLPAGYPHTVSPQRHPSINPPGNPSPPELCGKVYGIEHRRVIPGPPSEMEGNSRMPSRRIISDIAYAAVNHDIIPRGASEPPVGHLESLPGRPQTAIPHGRSLDILGRSVNQLVPGGVGEVVRGASPGVPPGGIHHPGRAFPPAHGLAIDYQQKQSQDGVYYGPDHFSRPSPHPKSPTLARSCSASKPYVSGAGPAVWEPQLSGAVGDQAGIRTYNPQPEALLRHSIEGASASKGYLPPGGHMMERAIDARHAPLQNMEATHPGCGLRYVHPTSMADKHVHGSSHGMPLHLQPPPHFQEPPRAHITHTDSPLAPVDHSLEGRTSKPTLRRSNGEVLCDMCDNRAAFLCSSCKQAAYCGRQCQIDGWNIHKAHCTFIDEENSSVIM